MKTIHHKIWLLAGLMLAMLSFSASHAQAQRQNEEELKKIENAKVAIITNRLNLTPEQSKGFWPIYNEFSQKRRDMNRSMREIIKGKGVAATDDQALNSLKEVQDLKQKQIELEKDCQERLLTVISAKQLTELYNAERDFNEMLLQRLK